MKKFKTLLASAVLLGMTTQTSFAQDYDKLDYKPYPYVFVTVQGGIQTTFTDYQNSKLITPITSLSVGGMFAPAVGARLNVNGWKTKGGLKSIDQTYDFNYVNSSLDLMLNMTNIVMPKKDHVYPFNMYLIGGVGLTYAWDNDDLMALIPSAPDRNLQYAWDDNRLTHSFRAGLQAEYNICKNFSVNLEVTANNYADRFNSKVNGKGDWQVQAMAGVTFKFGQKKNKVVAPVVAPTPAPKPAPVVAPAPKPAPVKKVEEKPVVKPAPKPEIQNSQIFFELNDSKINAAAASKIEELAKWMAAHPNAKVELVGYADAETGNSKYNQKLSQKRVNNVASVLVNKYGIDKSRISTMAKGDSEQPYDENHKNRVVLGVAK